MARAGGRLGPSSAVVDNSDREARMLGLPARLHALESVGKAVGVDDERDPEAPFGDPDLARSAIGTKAIARGVREVLGREPSKSSTASGT
jgi:hypothetical protein